MVGANLNWKKASKWILFVLIFNGIIFCLNTILDRKLSPSCFDEILISSKKDSLMMMMNIGGYGGDHTEYSEFEIENYNKGIPARFKLRVLGNSGIVTFSGLFLKEKDICRVVEIDTSYNNK